MNGRKRFVSVMCLVLAVVLVLGLVSGAVAMLIG